MIVTEFGSSVPTAKPGFCISRHALSAVKDAASRIQPPHPFAVYRSTEDFGMFGFDPTDKEFIEDAIRELLDESA